MTHFGVICPIGSHLTTLFVLSYELQHRGHRVTFINILDIREKVLGQALLENGARCELAEARRSVWALHPPRLEQEGLSRTLQHLVNGITTGTTLQA